MSYSIQRFDTPEGTPMVILPATEFERLLTLADQAEDVVVAEAELARIRSGAGTMPGEVLDAMLDEGLTAVAAWRRYRGLSQSDLAAKAGLSQVFVSKIERGESHGLPRTRKALASALGAPMWTLEDDSMWQHNAAVGSLAERICDVVAKRPGMTAREIAEQIYAGDAYQQKVNPDCRHLVDAGKLIRSGAGGPADPFTYRVT